MILVLASGFDWLTEGGFFDLASAECRPLMYFITLRLKLGPSLKVRKNNLPTQLNIDRHPSKPHAIDIS
jgi:hypothetical protein